MHSRPARTGVRMKQHSPVFFKDGIEIGQERLSSLGAAEGNTAGVGLGLAGKLGEGGNCLASESRG